MDLRKFILNKASLQSRPKRRRHSIADVRFLHTLQDIPEKPEEEKIDDERRRSTGSYQNEERTRSTSEPPNMSTPCCDKDDIANVTNAYSSDDNKSVENTRFRSLSREESNDLIEAVSTYVLSYTDSQDNVCNADDLSPSTTGSSSPHESSRETSDEELALSQILGKVDTPMVPQRPRRESMIDPEVMERITSLTPIVEYSRSSSLASVSSTRNGLDASPDSSDGNEGTDRGSRSPSLRDADKKEDMLGKILVSPRLTRRGSLSNVLKSLSPQFDSTNDRGRQGMGNDGKISPGHLSPHTESQMKDLLRPLSPMDSSKFKTVCKDNLQKSSTNESQSKKENGNVLSKIMNSPTLLKRRSSVSDVLRSLSPFVGSSPSKSGDSEKAVTSEADKEKHESDGVNKEKDGLFGKIIKSPCLTRRGSIGNVLNTLSPNPSRRFPSPSPLTIKCDTHDDPAQKTQPVYLQISETKDVEKSPCDPGPRKGLLAIVQQRVMNHSQAMQRKRSNSIASAKPHTTASKTTANYIDNKIKNNLDNNNNNSSSSSSSSKKSINTNQEDNTPNSKNPEIPSPQIDDLHKTTNLSVQLKSNETSQPNVNHELIPSLPKQLVGSESNKTLLLNLEQDFPSVKSPQRKISAPIPMRRVDAPEIPQRKSSVNVIKRSPATFVISNGNAGRTEDRNLSEFQMPSGVSFTNSRFLPLNQEEADDYNRIKNAEECKSSKVNSTVTMSSKVTVYGGSGSGVVRKLGIALKRPILDDSLPTEERFAALSERYASLKAKIGGNDSKQKSQESSPKPVEKCDCGQSTEHTLTQSKCWTTVESIPVQEFVDRVSDKLRDLTQAETQKTFTVKDEDNQITDGEEHDFEKSQMAITSNDFNDVTSCTNDREKDTNVDVDSNNKPSITETQVEEDGIPSDSSLMNGRSSLHLRPESPAQRTRTSVVAKLMNRKMTPRRKQSIVPCVVKRRSKVYTEDCSGYQGIPASAAQFEKIRTLVENTLLRAPVRQEALTIQELLNGLSSCLTEVELVAVCKECSKTLRTLDALGSLPTYLSLETVIINPSGTIKFKHLSTGISIDDLYLAPEHSNKFASEKTCVFSLAATLWSAADWRLTEAEKPSLSSKFQELLVSMTDDAPDARPCLYDVLQTCESFQTEGDMTSRERCQALLWEYQASAAMDSDDTTKRKTVQEDKKHHDTLMGSISVAASFKGFLKQTEKPQERNPFVKAQNNRESSSNIDGVTAEVVTNKTIRKPEELKAEKTTVLANSQMSEATSSSSIKSAKKGLLLSDLTTDRSSSAADDNNNQNPTKDQKRSHSLTEDEKQQLLSLLASTKLNKAPFYTGDNEKKSEEFSKAVEEQPVKPPSPSLFAYPHYNQSEGQMMFNPIMPAGRSASPSVHSDVSENQMPSVPTPTFVPIAVPIPSVAPVPMPPYWYMPQGGMMPYPHPAMSPVPFVPNESSVTSNQSVVSTDSDVSNLSDLDPRPKNTRSATPKFDNSESSKSDTQQRTRRSSAVQDNKGSKLPRPIWQTPVAKSRTSSVESESNTKVVRRRVPSSDGFNESSEEIKPVRARTPSPSLGRRTTPKEVTPPRSQTPPVYWTRGGVDMPVHNKPRARASTGSFPNWRPPSPSSSPDGRRRSSSASLGSTPNSPVQRPRSQQSRPSSPAGSRSNSPVSMLVSKFEQMSQESADSSLRVCSNSVTSMISKFGSSSLVPEDRMTKGQFKPNVSTVATQPASKTGPFRPSSIRDKVPSASDHDPSPLRPSNPISSRDRSRSNESSQDESSIRNSTDPREVQRSGSDPGSTDSRQRRLSSSHGTLHKEKESTSDRCYDSTTRLLENIRKWTSQENIIRECSSSGTLEKSVQERLVSGLSLIDDYCTKSDQDGRKGNSKARPERSPSGKSFSSTFSGRSSSSNDLRNDYIIKPSNVSHNFSKPWQAKGSSSNEVSRKSSLDSEPVREKGSPRLRPRDLCLSPERDSSIQYCDVRSPNDLLWSPKSDAHKFEIPVDLAILDATTPTVSSSLTSVGGFDLTYGGVDGNVISPTYPLSPGSLKDFKPSNYFTSVTFKCGEMEPERDTNCLPKKPSREAIESVSSDTVTNRRDPTDNYVRRFERKIIRSTGDIENEVLLSNSASGVVQNLTSRDSKIAESAGQNCFTPTGNPSSKKETKCNTRPVPNSSPIRSTTEGSSATTHVNGDPQTPRTRSRIDQVLRSRHPSGDSPPGKDIAAVPRNPPSPMTLRKIMSNPLSQDANTSRSRTATSKRNSLPTSQPINLSSIRERSNPVKNRPITKSSSHTNLSPNQQTVHKSSSQNNLSVRTSEDLTKSLSKGSVLRQEKDNGNLCKSNPHSKPLSPNNPRSNGEDIKTKSSTNPGNPHPSKERHGAKEHSRDRSPYSSNPHVRASRTTSSTNTTNPSESNPVRYPYTRRGSTPAKSSSTIKPPPKSASNPTSPLYPKPSKGQIEFFGAAGANYYGNPRDSINPRDPNGQQENPRKSLHKSTPRPRSQSSEGNSAESSSVGNSVPGNPRGNPPDPSSKQENLKGTHHNPTSKPRRQSNEGSNAASSNVVNYARSHSAERLSKSSPTSVFPSREQLLEANSSSVGKPEESEVFYTPRSEETLPKNKMSSGITSRRFPSSSSSDSGLTLSDTDEARGSNGKGNKSYRVRSPPVSPITLSPLHSPSPTSPKFPIGNNIFYDPKDHKPPPTSSEKGPPNVLQNDPMSLALLSNSIQQGNASNPFKDSSAKPKESPNKTVRSDSDNSKHSKSDTSKITDKASVNLGEKTNIQREKSKEVPAAAKPAVEGRIVKQTSKEFVAATTPPPDILGRPSSKSPPSSSKVDSKELLGQLVKKVLNSAAAKQGSSPKASFAESANSAAKESDKGKLFLSNETIEAKQKEKTSSQGQNPTTNSSKHKSRLSDTDKASKKKEQGLLNTNETTSTRNREVITPVAIPLGTSNETPISPSNASMVEGSSPEVQSSPEIKGVLSTIIDMIHDEFAFDGYLDDGVEDVNMAKYVLSLAGLSEENFKEAITDQYSDLYWDEDLLHDMYEAVTGEQQTRRPTLQFSESTVSDISPPESISLSREGSYLSLEPLYFNSISRSSSERSGTGGRDILMSSLGEATEFLPIKVIAPEMQADIQELLTPIFEDYHRVMGVKLVSSVEELTEKLGTKIMEISQQLMLERRAKKKSMNSYNKMADVENKRDVKDLGSKLVNEIEECDKKIIYLKNVQRQLRNVYAERFGLDTSLLYSFLVSYNKTSVSLVPELNNNFLNFSPIWNQRVNESTGIVDESLCGPSLQSGTKLGLFSYLFDRHAMSQAYVRYFLYTFRYIATAQELFTFIREKCSASLRTDSSGQVYNHQLQIRYRALDLLSEWIDGFYQFDFKTNPNLIKELLAFVKDELILVDRSERGHYLMELIAEKQKRDFNNNLSSDEPSDFVAVLQLEDPQGLSPVDALRKPMGSRKAKSPVQCFRRATPEKDTTYKATLYLKALSVLDHSSRILAEQLTLIQQDLFLHIHPVHFLNSRAHGIGVGRSQSPTRERDSIFGFSTGSRRGSEMPSLGEGAVSREQNMYASEPSTDGRLENLLEHAQDVSLWVAVEICSASSIKAQLALITKFVNAARYCCEIRNYSTCIQIIDALEMFVIRHLPVWKQVPTKTAEALEELKAVKVLLKTDSTWLMKSEASRDKPTIPCFLSFVMHVQQQELGGFTLPNDMYKWTKMRSTARLVDQIRLFKQMRYAFQTDDEVKERLKQRIQECKNENLHALASENSSNFHLSSSHGSRKFHDAFRKMKATFGGHN